MASTDGMLLAGRDGVNTWKLTFGESRRLTVTPGIINHHGYGKPPCDVFITDEPFTWVHAREDLRIPEEWKETYQKHRKARESR